MFPLSSNTGKLNLNVTRLDANTIRADTYLNLPTGPLGNARKLVNATDMDVLDADTGDLVAFNNANLNMSGGNISNINELSGSGVDLRIADSVDLLNNDVKNVNNISATNVNTDIITAGSSIRISAGGADSLRIVEDSSRVFLQVPVSHSLQLGANLFDTNATMRFLNQVIDVFGPIDFNNNIISKIRTPTADDQPANKLYVDNAVQSKWDNDAGTATLKTAANINMAGQAIKSLANPVDISDAANKFYVDNNYGSATITATGAVTNENGGVNVTLVENLNTGQKGITFDENINQSRISVTMQDAGLAVLDAINVNYIEVHTYNLSGALTNLQFNYIVYPA